jgi:hypothetical protein
MAIIKPEDLKKDMLSDLTLEDILELLSKPVTGMSVLSEMATIPNDYDFDNGLYETAIRGGVKDEIF